MPATKEKLTPELARTLLVQRWQEACSRITPEAIATGKHGERHEIQIKVLQCKKQNMIFMCSRRAGKSEVCCGLILQKAVETNDVSCLYLGLTKDAAEPVWRKWKRLLKRLDIPNTSSDAQQYTEFPNGSRVLFAGTDDLRTVSHYLGDQLAGGIAILDECQSDAGLMEVTIEDVLGPMLDETTHDKPIPGRLVLSGTVPDGPIGYYWKTWEENRNHEDTETKEGSLWETFAWSRYENPFQTNNEQREDEYCRKYRRDHKDPAVLRRFHGTRIWGKDANAYRFDRLAHVYSPSHFMTQDIGPFHCTFAAQPIQCDRVIVGIQQYQGNGKFAIVAWTWNQRRRDKVYQIAEAVTDADADPQESEWLAICAELKARYPYGGMLFIRGAEESSDPVNEALRMSHGIEMKTALKTPGSVKARVQRLSDLLTLDIAKVIDGSQLCVDLMKAKWNAAKKAARKWELDTTHESPDIAKAATYAFDLMSYTSMHGKNPDTKPMSFDEKIEAEHKKEIARLYRTPSAVTLQPPFVDHWLPPPK